MLENEPTTDSANVTDSAAGAGPTGAARRSRRPAKAAAAAPPAAGAETAGGAAPVKKAAKASQKKAAKRTETSPKKASKKTAGPAAAAPPDAAEPAGAGGEPATKGKRSRGSRKGAGHDSGAEAAASAGSTTGAAAVPSVLFQAPSAAAAAAGAAAPAAEAPAAAASDSAEREGRRRRRGGRGRRPHGEGRDESRTDESRGDDGHTDDVRTDAGSDDDSTRQADDAGDRSGGPDDGETTSSRRRRRRRRRGGGGDGDEQAPDDPPNTVVRVREPREHNDERVQGVKGSTRLEAKKQRRREGREMVRRGRRGLVLTEAEFLARRESVERVMVVRQRGERTQIGVLEDDILVEHFVSTGSNNRMVGNVYLGRVQNVLPGMEAAFVDIGKGRNAVLYAGEVNFDMTGMEGQQRRIESALKSGQQVVVQVTKDPIGHKGARLTSQVSLPGRFLVLVPEGSMMGISRKLPDNERSRLKTILRQVMPEGAGVIVRTAAEGASEEELTRDIARLSAQWEDIKRKAETAEAPSLLYGEPDLTIRVIRDVFNEDFSALVVQADSEWDMVEAYVGHVAPDLVPRLTQWTSEEDVFRHYRVDEQLAKALDRKVWLPSGGYLVIDRTEAMIVIDVNTGRFIGKGGNLEETVTKNNLEAAEEIVRQLRLRDIGGIIVIDFIDMVLESNRELVLRRLVECLGRDRTKHQVAEVTSLGLVQMTRKRVGTGLLEAFSEPCEHCSGRGVIVHTDPVDQRPKPAPTPRSGSSRGRRADADGVAGPSGDSDGPRADTARADGAASNGSRSRRGGRRRSGSGSGSSGNAEGGASGSSDSNGAGAKEQAAQQPVTADAGDRGGSVD